MKNFSFIKNFKITALIAIILILIGIGSFIFQGFNFDIDFTGGTTMTVDFNKTLDREELDKISDTVAEVIGENPSSVQKAGEDGNLAIIKTQDLDSTKRDEVFEKLKTTYNLSDDDKISVDNVDPVVGKDLRDSAIISLTVALVLMLVYIAIRFEFVTGIVAIIALAHDVLIMMLIQSLFQLPLNLTFVAALLTIVGYSINNTIIIFDRVRENKRLASKKETFEEIIDKSIRQTMLRSVNTTITTLITITILYFIGVQSIKIFALPIIVGLIAGFYSSVFLAGPLWAFLRKAGFGVKK